MNTTRRFPRTLHEAFPADARHACAIERSRSRRWVEAACAVLSIAGFLAMVVLAIVGWAAQ